MCLLIKLTLSYVTNFNKLVTYKKNHDKFWYSKMFINMHFYFEGFI